jgi:vacuolar protein-sorting-associated protein 4
VLIRKKVDEYLDRAEKLKTHIAKAESKTAGVIGSNGKVSAGGGGKYVFRDFSVHPWLTRPP